MKELSEKMNVNVRTKEGDIPLMFAIRNNLADTVQILIINCANPDFPNNSNYG